MSLTENRKHIARLRRKRSKYNCCTGVNIGKVVNTPACCNCWMCRNPRTLYGESFQELRQKEHYKYEDF